MRYEVDARVEETSFPRPPRSPRDLVLTGRRHGLWSADYSGAAREEAEWSLLPTTHVNTVRSRTHSHTQSQRHQEWSIAAAIRTDSAHTLRVLSEDFTLFLLSLAKALSIWRSECWLSLPYTCISQPFLRELGHDHIAHGLCPEK